MTNKLNDALANVECTYSNLIEIANTMLNPIICPANEIINSLSKSIHNISIEQLRDYILQIQLKSFELSEIKEKSTLKADIAAALQKEQFAIQFNSVEGAAAVKDKIATVNTSDETVVTAVYNLAANLLKTKLDELHRMVDSLKSILMSRMQEAKFMQIGSTNEIALTTNGKITLNE